MPAPAGNSFWTTRSSHGRKPKFETPDALWDACCEYFDWIEANPLWEDKLVTFQGAATHEPVSKMRAMTIVSLCIFLDISFQTWQNYKAREDFVEIVTRVEEIIKTQKFQGAAADLLNPNIIARELGLVDKQETTHEAGNSIADLMKAINGRTRSK